MVTGRPAMARKIPAKSLCWKARSLWRCWTRWAASSAMIMLCTIGRRSSPWNMCSVRQRPMPSAPNSRARAASSGVSALARTDRVRARSAHPRIVTSDGLLGSGGSSGASPAKTVPLVPSIVTRSPSRNTCGPIEMEPSSAKRMAVTPQTAGLPMPTATMAAWLVLPPRAVRMPWAATIPWKSSGVVSSRTRITGSPARPSRSASSAVKTTAPVAAPGEAATPRASGSGAARRSSWGSSSWRTWSGSTSDRRASSSLTSPSATMSTAMRTMACALRLPLRVWSM